MLTNFSNNNYQIIPFTNNQFNNAKFFYIDTIDGDITFYDTKWFFSLNFWIRTQSILPNNFFEFSINLPFCAYENISVQKQHPSSFPNFLDSSINCELYQAKFSIDISETGILDQKLNYENFYCYLKTSFNSNILDAFDINTTQENLDYFISEVNLQQKKFDFEYSNYEKKWTITIWKHKQYLKN